MKNQILRILTAALAVLFAVSPLTACRGDDAERPEDTTYGTAAADETLPGLSIGPSPGSTCMDGRPHTYPGTTLCEDMTCQTCGYVLRQTHQWVLSEDSTATLLHGGTVIRVCAACEERETSETAEPLSPDLLDMPVVYLSDLPEAATPVAELQKEDGEIAVRCAYVSNDAGIPSFDCFSKVKIQGATSAKFPKKNFTIKLYEDEALTQKNRVDLGWGRENQYCLKANYIDFSQARNIVGARLFAEMVASREEIPAGLADAPNYGLIDGYPVLVYVNGTFHGLYTMNIPKDHWQFGMEGGEESREAILMANGWTQSVTLDEKIGKLSSGKTWEDYGWKVEHCSTADDAWVRDSFNRLINVLNSSDGRAIASKLPRHLDIDAAIDNMIFTYFLNAADNVAKNILWVTYDGEVWIPSMYDMDGTFGLYWNGQPLGTDRGDGLPENTIDICPSIQGSSLHIPGNRMYQVLCRYFPERVEARYRALREGLLTYEHTKDQFDAFFAQAHEIAYASDMEEWKDKDDPTIPYCYATRNKDSMYNAVSKQLGRLDKFFYRFKKYV